MALKTSVIYLSLSPSGLDELPARLKSLLPQASVQEVVGEVYLIG